jgi:hypothetical protein
MNAAAGLPLGALALPAETQSLYTFRLSQAIMGMMPSNVPSA